MTVTEVIQELKHVASVHPEYMLEEIVLHLRYDAVTDIVQILISEGVLPSQARVAAEARLLDYFATQWLSKVLDAARAEARCAHWQTPLIAGLLANGAIVLNDPSDVALATRGTPPYPTGRI